MKIYVRPSPHFKSIPEIGEWVEDSEFWQRRLADGDVEIAKPPAETKKGEK